MPTFPEYLDTGDALGVGGGNMLLIASSTSPDEVKDRADVVCTGTADQTTINTWAAFGAVAIADGDYNITATVQLKHPGSKMWGPGPGYPMTNGDSQGRGFGARFVLGSSFTATQGAAVLVDQENTYVVGGYDLGYFAVDGAAYTATAVDGVKARGFLGHLTRIICNRMSGNGFHLLGNESPDPAWSTYDTTFSGLIASYCTGAGLYMGANSADVIGSNSLFLLNDGPGVHFASGSSSQFTNVHTYTNEYGYLFSGGGARTKLSNCKIEHSQKDGILFDTTTGVTGTDSVQIDNCGFNCNGESANNTYDHIGFHTKADPAAAGTVAHTNVQIRGCNFGNSDGEPNLARYCINLWTQGTKAVIQGNNFRDTLALAGVVSGRVSWTSTTVKETLTMTGNAGQADMRGSPVPSVAMQSGAGTSPPAAVVTAGSTTTKGRITWGTGTSPNNTAAVVRVTYAVPFVSSGQVPIVTPINEASANLDMYVVTNNLDYFEVRCATAPAASQGNTVYGFYYAIGE